MTALVAEQPTRTTLACRITERELFEYADPQSAFAMVRSRIDAKAAEEGLGAFQYEEISYEMLFHCYAVYRTYVERPAA